MQVVVRALTVLTYLSEHPEGKTLQGISDALSMPVATVHRLLGTLTAEEFTVRGAERCYTLGSASLGLSKGVRRAAEVARPFMRRLSEQTQETVFLSELVGNRVVCVGLVEGSRPLRLFVRIGQEMPVHAAASARSVLAFQPDDLVNGILAGNELVRFRPGTPTTVAAVRAHLAKIRDRGFDVCDEELDPNVVAISAPVWGASGTVVAGLTLAAPRNRMDSVTLKREVLLVTRTAKELSASLGFTTRPPGIALPSDGGGA